ncbi:hypothetical protein AHAS_Ahas16G0196100 [Arachis hypogaea]
MGVPLEHQGMARQYKFPEKKLKVQEAGRATWCRRRGTPASKHHLGVPLQDLGVARHHYKRPKQSWACHLVSKAWHANSQSSLGRAT